MRRLIAACAVFFAASASAQTAPEITPALFAVRDADSTLYIYGTIHQLPENAQWSNASVRAALDSAQEVWVESDQSEETGRRFMREMTASMETPAAVSLLERVPVQYRQTLRYLDKNSEFDVERLEPWQAALMFIAYGSQYDARSSFAGVDSQVVAAAEANGARLRWLEVIRASDFAALSEETQVQFLLFVLDGIGSPGSELVEMEAMWANGDLEGLYASQLAEMQTNYPAFYGWIAVARNNAWMDILVRELEGAGVDFVAVGTAHLLGADGLVEQMRARGYAVERVTN
jgi:uncharacterized protein YbaP (TraB family)